MNSENKAKLAKPKAKLAKRKLIITFIKHNRFIELLQAILYFTNIKDIFTHVQLGFSDSVFDFSAESKGLKFVKKAELENYKRGLEKYKVPIKEEQFQLVEDLFEEYLGMKYDYYIYPRWALNIFSVFIIPILFFFGILSQSSVIPFGIILAIFYFPIRMWLKKKSSETYACAEITSLILDRLGIDLGLNGKFSTASPYIMRRLIRFASWLKIK